MKLSRTVRRIHDVFGLAAEHKEELARVKSDYNLRLLFAVSGSGALLAKLVEPHGKR